MVPVFVFAAALQASVPAGLPADPWPTVRAGRVLVTPNWSDYRIYPAAALRKNQEGRVVPELLVGPDGKPQACRIVVSSRFAELDSGTCDLLMQMRFEPARDEAGVPTASRFSRPMLWALTDPRDFASSSLETHVRVQDGKLAGCRVVGGDGPYVAYWSALACDIYSDVAFYFGGQKPSLNALVAVRLTAGNSDQPAAALPWPDGTPIASEKIAFTINSNGDPSGCRAIETSGLGHRGLNNLSPCGRLLSDLWFKKPVNGSTRSGIIETRVVAIEP